MMDELIYRQDAANILCDWCDICPKEERDIMHCDDVCPQFARLPSAQHRPYCYLDSPCPYQNEEIKVTQKKGHWVHDTIISPINNMEISLPSGVCSECDIHVEYTSKFCPNCGADMRGEADGENS